MAERPVCVHWPKVSFLHFVRVDRYAGARPGMTNDEKYVFVLRD